MGNFRALDHRPNGGGICQEKTAVPRHVCFPATTSAPQLIGKEKGVRGSQLFRAAWRVQNSRPFDDTHLGTFFLPRIAPGCARVSTLDQNPALQIAALKKSRCTYIFEDKLSGATTKRPALVRCLKTLRAGDTLVVWKLDRLGRSLRDLITMLDELRDRGVVFQSLTESIDTATPTGRAMWQVIGVLAELERNLIVERTRAGMQAARANGARPGPKHKLNRERIEHARELRAIGKSADVIADLLDVSRATIYRALAN